MAILDEIGATPEQVVMVGEMYGLAGTKLKAAVSVDIMKMLKTKWYLYNREDMKKSMKKFSESEEE